jgi:tetratricopeptide (TPR) repeat protein
VIHRRRARAAYAEAAVLSPTSAPHHLALGSLSADLGRADEAAREFDRAIALDPNNAIIRVAAASAAQRTGARGRACAHAVEARRLFPAFGPPAAQLAHLAEIEGRREEAARFWRTALALQWYELHDFLAAAESRRARADPVPGRVGE